MKLRIEEEAAPDEPCVAVHVDFDDSDFAACVSAKASYVVARFYGRSAKYLAQDYCEDCRR